MYWSKISVLSPFLPILVSFEALAPVYRTPATYGVKTGFRKTGVPGLPSGVNRMILWSLAAT